MEKRIETFNLTSPSTVEGRFLIFKSQSEKCAIFFALKIHLGTIPDERTKRTLTILLKVIPELTIFSIEWTANNECFLTFYIKSEKGAVLVKAKEFVDNIQASFGKIFGRRNIRLLRVDELLQHLSLGIPEKIRQASIIGRFTILLKTKNSQQTISMIQFKSFQMENLQTILQEIRGNTKNIRFIFAVQRKKSSLIRISSKVLLFTTDNNSTFCSSKIKSVPKTFQQIRASDLLQNLGNVLARNIFRKECKSVTCEMAVEQILSFLKLCRFLSEISESAETPMRSQQPAKVSSPQWRNALKNNSERLGLVIEKDVFVSVSDIPFRLDAKIGDLLFKIIPSHIINEEKLQWLISQLDLIVKSNQAKSIVLLISNSEISFPIEAPSENGVEAKRIYKLTSIPELHAFLLQHKTTLLQIDERATEVVGKML